MAVPFRLLALAIGLSTIASRSPSGAATIRVPSQQPTIQQAINAAASGDTVLLAPGTYTGASNRNLSFLNKDLVLTSEQGPVVTIIDCQSLSRAVFLLDAESPILRGITIKNGAGISGAGIFCVGAQPEIINCVFRNNVATERGGGLCCVWSSVELDSCQFIDNTARFNHEGTGGGIYAENSTLTATYDSFVNNLSGRDGGGIHCRAATIHLNECLFQLNHSSDGEGGAMALISTFAGGSASFCRFLDNFAPSGGAIVSDNSAYTFSGCRFEHNQANMSFECTGGAADIGSGGLTFLQCLFNDNVASDIKGEGLGGAIFIFQQARADLNHCTLYDNRATSDGPTGEGHGGGLYVGGQAMLQNTIIAFGSEGEAVFCAGGTVTVDCCDIYGNVDGDWVGCLAGLNGVQGNISQGPFFCDPESGNFGIAPFSPCAVGHSPPECGLIGAFGVDCGFPVGIADPAEAATASLRIWNYPNPFNPSTTIVYQLPSPGLVTVTLFDVAGRWVRGLIENQLTEPGEHRIAWDGTDESGRSVESGVYFGHLLSGGQEEVRRLVLLR